VSAEPTPLTLGLLMPYLSLGNETWLPSHEAWKLPQDQLSSPRGPQGEAGRELGNELKFHPLESDFNLAAHGSAAITS